MFISIFECKNVKIECSCTQTNSLHLSNTCNILWERLRPEMINIQYHDLFCNRSQNTSKPLKLCRCRAQEKSHTAIETDGWFQLEKMIFLKLSSTKISDTMMQADFTHVSQLQWQINISGKKEQGTLNQIQCFLNPEYVHIIALKKLRQPCRIIQRRWT